MHHRKFFLYHTPKNWYFWNEGWYLRRLFSQHPDQLERNGLDCRQHQHLFYLSAKSHFSMTSVGDMREESREHSFQLIYQSDWTWFNHQFHLSYISANHWKQLEKSVKHQQRRATVHYASKKRTRWWEPCNFRRYLSTNTVYQYTIGIWESHLNNMKENSALTSKTRARSYLASITRGLALLKPLREALRSDPSVVAKKWCLYVTTSSHHCRRNLKS